MKKDHYGVSAELDWWTVVVEEVLNWTSLVEPPSITLSASIFGAVIKIT